MKLGQSEGFYIKLNALLLSTTTQNIWPADVVRLHEPLLPQDGLCSVHSMAHRLFWCVLCVWCWMRGGRNRFRQSNTGVTEWLGMKRSNPVGEFAFSDPVSWHCLPTDRPPCPSTYFISPGSTCTFQNRLIQLNITPAESWVTLSVDPFSLSFFHSSSHSAAPFNSNPLFTLLSLIHIIPQTPSAGLLIGMPQRAGLKKDWNTCFRWTRGEQFDGKLPTQEHVQISWAEWDLINSITVFFPTLPQSCTIHFHEMSFQSCR